MPKQFRSLFYGFLLTGFLIILLTGCDLRNHGKTDALIEIDLNQKGIPYNPKIYEKFFKATPHENDLEWKEAISEFTESLNQKDTLTSGWEGILRVLSVGYAEPFDKNLDAALGVAAFRVEIESNFDTLHPPSFVTKEDVNLSAHLMVHLNGRTYATPSYYAIRLFSENRPDKLMPVKVTMNNEDTSGYPVTAYLMSNSIAWNRNEEPIRPKIYAAAGIQEKAGFVIIKLVNPFKTPRNCKIVLNYHQQIKYKGEAYVMTSGSGNDKNSFKDPEKIVPMTKELKGLKNTFYYECPANAIVVIKLRYKKGVLGIGNCC